MSTLSGVDLFELVMYIRLYLVLLTLFNALHNMPYRQDSIIIHCVEVVKRDDLE